VDIDNIIMRALEVEPARRHQSAADLTRYFEHQPVLANPPDIIYRVRKFLRRHRIPVVAAAAVILELSMGLANSPFRLPATTTNPPCRISTSKRRCLPRLQ
jgi:serine/threonine protein kinase